MSVTGKNVSPEIERRPRQYAQAIGRRPVDEWKAELQKVPAHLRKMTRLHLVLLWERKRD